MAKTPNTPNTNNGTPFPSDVNALRDQARKKLEKGAATPAHGGDVKAPIEVLQNGPATEIVCVLRYTQQEERADDLHDLLEAHEGQPMLQDG